MIPEQKPYTAEDLRERRYRIKVEVRFAHYNRWVEIESWTQFVANGLCDVVVKALAEGNFKDCDAPAFKEELIEEIK